MPRFGIALNFDRQRDMNKTEHQISQAPVLRIELAKRRPVEMIKRRSRPIFDRVE